MKYIADATFSHNPRPTTHNPPMTDDEFIRAFESCTLPEAMFHHRDHLRLAWLYLGRYGHGAAQARIAESIRRYAASLGKAEKYHHTMTLAWLKLVAGAVQRLPGSDLETLLAAHPYLLDKKALEAHYSSSLLGSETARQAFVEPDLKPLPA